MTEDSRRKIINGVRFYNDKGTLAFENEEGELSRYYPCNDDLAPNERLASLFLDMALSLATPPDWTFDEGSSGDMLHEEYGGQSSNVELSDWVNRVERAAVLVNAAAECRRISWNNLSGSTIIGG